MQAEPANISQMLALRGRWIGRGEVFANPFGPAGTTEGEWNFRMDGPGLHLIHNYRERREDGHIFEGHGVFAIDPATTQFVWYWFDTYGHPPLAPARGRWTAHTLELVKTTPRGTARTTFSLQDGHLVYDIWTKLEGASDFAPITHAVFEHVAAEQ